VNDFEETGETDPPLCARYPLSTTLVTIGGRRWTLASVQDQNTLIQGVHTDADLEQFPYGLLLWPAAMGLAEQIAGDPALVAGKRVLELGAGVGLPGLVAQSLGGRVTQTDYQDDALALARRNARRNQITGVRYRRADWRAWPDGGETYEVVLGSDVLYERSLHKPLAALLPRLLAPGGLIVLSDPLRPQAWDFVDYTERDGWRVHLHSRHVRQDDGTFKEIALFLVRR